jgi:hypothetical protein
MLEESGHSVIGVDLHDAEVIADLGTAEGRATALGGVLDACHGMLDGYAGFAGVPPTSTPPYLLPTVGYFGGIALLEGLRDALRRGDSPSAVAVSSCAATVSPIDEDLVSACLTGDESAAIALSTNSVLAYSSVKLALARWVRRQSASWASDGIRLNALAPGNTRTPLTDVILADPELGPPMRKLPVPIGHWAEPGEVAAAAHWLLGPASSFVIGSVLFVDGGTDAQIRPDTF